MKCSQCGGRVLVESAGPNTTRVTCQECGHADIKNQSGQRLLTDDAPQRAPRGPRSLTEG